MNDLCPICNQPATLICRCALRDSRCARGHQWYHCPIHENVSIVGQIAHRGDAFTCLCDVEPDNE
jgi:hypothetical protein